MDWMDWNFSISYIWSNDDHDFTKFLERFVCFCFIFLSPTFVLFARNFTFSFSLPILCKSNKYKYGFHQCKIFAAGGWSFHLSYFGCRRCIIWSMWRFGIFRIDILCFGGGLSIPKCILLSMCSRSCNGNERSWGRLEYCSCSCNDSFGRLKLSSGSIQLGFTSIFGYYEEKVLFNYFCYFGC